jgi:hypothetical protein
VLTLAEAAAYIRPTRGRRRLEAALRFTLGSLDADRDGVRLARTSRLRGRSTKVGRPNDGLPGFPGGFVGLFEK